MANIKLLYGTGVTATNPPKVDGHLLFDIGSKSIYFDVNGDRIKLYESLDTAITDITDLKTKVGTETVAKQIADAIANLKKTVVAEVENSDTVTLSLADNADTSAKKLKAEVKLSSKADNALKNGTGTAGEEGLYVAPAAAPEYTIEKAATAETGFASTYKLMKDGVQVGASINIAKDKFLKSVNLVDQDSEGTAGKFIKMVFEDDTNSTIYLNVNELVDVYTSGSADGAMVVIAVDETTNKITATITDGTITKAKLHADVQATLSKADSALQAADIEEGSANGTISVNGSDVNVHGLGSAAYEDSSAFDKAGAANAVLGSLSDDLTKVTVYGSRAYTDSMAQTVKQQIAGNADDAINADTLWGAKNYSKSMMINKLKTLAHVPQAGKYVSGFSVNDEGVVEVKTADVGLTWGTF